MSEVPPRLIRRALTVPGTLALAVAAAVLLPLTLLLAALHDLIHLRHRGRAIRSVVVVTVFLWIETWAIWALGTLWVESGFGRRLREPEMQRRHYELILQYLDRCFALTEHLLSLRVELEGVTPASLLDRPLLVFCRHAGVGDSLLIVHALMKHFGREPRIVLKDLLQWAPAVDIALNRLPSAWITAPASPSPAPGSDAAEKETQNEQGRAQRARARATAEAVRAAMRDNPTARERAQAVRAAVTPEPPALRPTGEPIGPPAADTLADRAQENIAALASRLDGDDVMVIFPEGGNFTPRRRQRAIARLWREGRRRHARQAQQMQNVLPPRPGGVLAALEAGPEADVIWVAHTGTDHLMSPRAVWRELPLRHPILMHWWQVPAAEVPRTRDEQIAWLYGWWERIDQWVAHNRAPEAQQVIELPDDPLPAERPPEPAE